MVRRKLIEISTDRTDTTRMFLSITVVHRSKETRGRDSASTFGDDWSVHVNSNRILSSHQYYKEWRQLLCHCRRSRRPHPSTGLEKIQPMLFKSAGVGEVFRIALLNASLERGEENQWGGSLRENKGRRIEGECRRRRRSIHQGEIIDQNKNLREIFKRRERKEKRTKDIRSVLSINHTYGCYFLLLTHKLAGNTMSLVDNTDGARLVRICSGDRQRLLFLLFCFSLPLSLCTRQLIQESFLFQWENWVISAYAIMR